MMPQVVKENYLENPCKPLPQCSGELTLIFSIQISVNTDWPKSP